MESTDVLNIRSMLVTEYGYGFEDKTLQYYHIDMIEVVHWIGGLGGIALTGKSLTRVNNML